MLGKTHIVLGMASALVALRPITVTGVVAAITSGALGGWIVDIDCKQADDDQEKINDIIIDAIVIAVLIALDFLIGNGMCQYVISHLGIPLQIALFSIVIITLIGFNTKHRTFTHSLLCMALYGISFYFFCRPACFPFLIGYASHLVADFFNKTGLQLFFPFKRRFCLDICYSNKKANQVLFWVGFSLTIALVALFFAIAMIKSGRQSIFVNTITQPIFMGLNSFEWYIIIINIITYKAVKKKIKEEQNPELLDEEDEDSIRIHNEFKMSIIRILTYMGGGIGLLINFLKHHLYPAGYNGNLWSICYASILLWFTVFCYICNPLNHEIKEIIWLSSTHFSLLIYLLGINIISALLVFSFRNKKYEDNSIVHTLYWTAGMLGGTVGAIPMGFFTHSAHSYRYLSMGFFFMAASQIDFVLYMMAIGVF